MKFYYNRYKRMGERSQKSIWNIIISFGAKGISILITLAVVPLTIHYVNPTRYGIWLTLSSIIAWIGFFDLGLGNGMRNKFAEAKSKGDIELAKQYVSTTYFTIGGIVLGLFFIVSIANQFIDWASVLNVEACYSDELRKVFGVLVTFFCLNMVVRLFLSLLTADQRPAVGSILGVIGQLLSLLAIYLLTKLSEGSLLKLAIFYAGIPTLTMFCWSVLGFCFTRYRQYAPRYSAFRKSLIKDIFNLGLKFFLIYLCLIVIFQIINITISRELGPDYVTQYNVAHRYFNIINAVAMIIITPFWSAFTDAYHKNDIGWMKRVKLTLEILWLFAVIIAVGMVFFADIFYHYWIGDEVEIGTDLTIGMAVFVLMQTLGALYMNLINGVGTVKLQLIIYVIFAVISYPLMLYSCRSFGLMGILIAPSLCYLVQAVFAKIQIEKILNGNSTGIWSK